jgi:hypothetical protein
MKSPSAARALTAPAAAPLVLVGRTIEQIGNLLLRNGQGSGIIRLACNDSGWLVVRSRNVTVDPVFGSVSVNGVALPGFPPLREQIRCPGLLQVPSAGKSWLDAIAVGRTNYYYFCATSERYRSHNI